MTVAEPKLSAKANDVFDKMLNIRSNKEGLAVLRGDFQSLDIGSRMKILQSIDYTNYENDDLLAKDGRSLCAGNGTADAVYFVAEVLATFAEAKEASPVIESVAEAMDEISDADFNNVNVLAQTLGAAIQDGFQRRDTQYKHQNPFKRAKNNRMRHISHR